MVQRYIEFDLPLKEISLNSVIEKNIRQGNPSSLLQWWARRPLTSSRATNFAALIDLPETETERNDIKKLLISISNVDNIKLPIKAGVKKARNKIINQWNRPPIILDPFAGGGSIPLEALRLGCEVYSTDLNPIAVFIQKATLEWPQKYSSYYLYQEESIDLTGKKRKFLALPYLIEKWANIIGDEVKSEINHFYVDDNEDELIGFLWARTIPCNNPTCKRKIPLVKQTWLAKYGDSKEKESIAFKFEVIDNKLEVIIKKGKEINFDPGVGTVIRGNVKCPFCDQIIDVKDVRKLFIEKKSGEKLLIVIYKDQKGKMYKIADEKDYNNYVEASNFLKNKVDNWQWLDEPLPEEDLPPIGTLGFRVQRYGLTKWKNLFNNRQLLSLITFIDKIKLNYKDILKDCNNIIEINDLKEAEEFSHVVMAYLSIMLARLSDFNSNLCVLNSTGGRGVVHVFGRNALPMTWDYAETYVFNPYGASWNAAIERTLMVLKNLNFKTATTGTCMLSSATNLPFDNNFFDAVFTDPPYYDNVPYADLSDFFYVWIKRCVGDLFYDIFKTPLTPKIGEIIADPSKQHDPKLYFESQLSLAFNEINRVLKPNGIATIVYAYKTTEGWETLLNSLINAKLVVTASWPIHTERAGRLRAASSAALASSIYMVCRKSSRIKLGFWNDLQNEIKNVVLQKLDQFWDEDIIGGDFFISAIGPGMEVYSRYERVETYSGETVSTNELLEYIRSVCSNYVINQLLKNGTSFDIDNESQFYLAFRWTYMDNRVEYDDARKLASSMGVYLEDMTGRTGLIYKKGKYIEVLNPKKRHDIMTPKTLIDIVHKCLMLWDQGKSDEIKELLKKTGYGMNEVFWRYCQAISESLLPGNKEKQLLEGFLIGRERYSDFTSTRDSKSKMDFYIKRE